MSDDELSLTIRLRHAYRGWRVSIAGEQEKEITAEEALAWAAHAGEEHARQVQAVIRADAEQAEEDAKAARKRAKDEVVRQAEAALAAETRALARRAEADQLAPAHEQPAPFKVGD